MEDIYNINEELNAGRKAGGNYYNLEKGDSNVLRVLTRSKELKKHFLGRGNPKPVCYGEERGCPIKEIDEKTKEVLDEHQYASSQYVGYILDRKDSKVKIMFIPKSVMISIGRLQENPDYKFSDMPMPYDIRITWDPDNEDNRAKYLVQVKPGGAELTEENKTDLAKALEEITPEQLRDKMIEKQFNQDTREGKVLEVNPKPTTEEYNATMKETMIKQRKEAGLNPTEDSYPGSELNPEDIPF